MKRKHRNMSFLVLSLLVIISVFNFVLATITGNLGVFITSFAIGIPIGLVDGILLINYFKKRIINDVIQIKAKFWQYAPVIIGVIIIVILFSDFLVSLCVKYKISQPLGCENIVSGLLSSFFMVSILTEYIWVILYEKKKDVTLYHGSK